MGWRWAKSICLASVGGVILVAGFLVTLAVPSTEAVRLRNTFLIEAGQPDDFNWTPAHPPQDFRSESLPAPERFRNAATEVVRGETQVFAKARGLAAHLLRNAQDKGAIQSGLDESYRRITGEGYGYCADFVRVFLALAYAADIPARQWAFSFDGFGGHGHTFVEVFDSSSGRWYMLDVFNNLYPVSPSGEPLSAMEFREMLLDPSGLVRVQRISDGRLEFPIEAKAIDYYRRGVSEWYLWSGNDVFSYDQRQSVRLGALFGRGAEQAMALAVGAYPHFKILDAERHGPELKRMTELRQVVVLNLLLAMMLVVLAAISGVIWWRQQGDQK